MTGSLLQWNCRGLFHNLDDIHSLLQEYEPSAFCLQETYLKPSKYNFLRSFQIFRKDRMSQTGSSGGVAIVVDAQMPSIEVPLDTSLEAVAVRLMLDRLVTVCSLYVSPTSTLTLLELEHLADQLPEPFVILGDLNAHNPLWGSQRLDSRGSVIERFLSRRAASILNTGEPTYFSSTHRSFSCIDLSIVSSSIFTCFTWSVLNNPYGSDHFPVHLTPMQHLPRLPFSSPRWKLSSANWELFQKNVPSLNLSEPRSVDEENSMVTRAIIEAAHTAIPRTSGKLPKRPKPWWNEDCRETRNKQNCAWTRFRRYPTAINLLKFKQLRARARYVRKQAKKTSWCSYTSSINSSTPTKIVWDRLGRMDGEYRQFSIPLLSPLDDTVSTLKDQANILGKHFEQVSSSENYSSQFLRHKSQAEKVQTRPQDGFNEEYNQSFTPAELRRALSTPKMTSPGPDGIHYSMLSHLPSTFFETLLEFFNHIWALRPGMCVKEVMSSGDVVKIRSSTEAVDVVMRVGCVTI